MGMRSFGWKETVVSFGIYYMKWIFGLWGTEIVIFYITGEDSGWTDWPSDSFWNTTWRCTSYVQTRGTETEQTQCEGWSLLHNKGHHPHKIEVRSDALKCNASLITFTMLQDLELCYEWYESGQISDSLLDCMAVRLSESWWRIWQCFRRQRVAVVQSN